MADQRPAHRNSGGVWRQGFVGQDLRGRRIRLLILGIWIMGLFDLVLTILAHQQGFLHESNPVADVLLPHGAGAISTFKVLLIGFGTWVLWRQRRLLLAEGVTWLIAMIYVGVSFQWMLCYDWYTVAYAYHDAGGQRGVATVEVSADDHEDFDPYAWGRGSESGLPTAGLRLS